MKIIPIFKFDKLIQRTPYSILRMVQYYFDLLGARVSKWEKKNPYIDGPFESEYNPKYKYKLGIIKEFWNQHWPYIQACREMKVGYQVIDITKDNWINNVHNSNCHAFLVWPSVQPAIWKQMFDERLKILSQILEKIVCPLADEVWYHESKRRVAYWLEANKIPHPKSWIFYNKKDALEFSNKTNFPIIFKPDRGSSAHGMEIFHEKKKLQKYIKKYFRFGFLHSNDDWRDLQWGSLVLQQYLENVDEWRMIRIGESYFGYKKGKEGDFHSGSKQVIFEKPPENLLDFTEFLTTIGGFSSMAFDIFQTKDNSYFVNEFHPVFGRDPWDHSMVIDGKPGRYIKKNKWIFEEGIFTENSCCNLRIEMILNMLQSTDVNSSKKNG